MAASADFIEYVEDLLRAFAPIRVRRMFGGAGVWSGELFFAIIADDELYFKVDGGNLEDYRALGLDPFRYTTKAGKSGSMSYYPVPAEVQEDPELLRDWARKALEAASAARKPNRR